MKATCENCGQVEPLAFCGKCFREAEEKAELRETERDEAESARDRAAENWRAAFENAVKRVFGKKPEELTVADTAAPWGRWVSGLLDVYKGKP